MRNRIAILSAAAMLAISSVALASLAGSGAAAQDMGRMGMAQQDVAVTLTEWSVAPRHIAVRAGQPVRFQLTNPSERPHELSITGGRVAASVVPGGIPAETFSSPRLTPGQATEWMVTIPRPGTYQVYCPVGDGGHKDRGMVGTLTVVGETEDAALPTPVTLGNYWIRPLGHVAIAGQPTRFELSNAGTSAHDLVVKGQGGEWQSPLLAVGESVRWDVTIEQPGIYELYCSRGDGAHRESGMVGTLEVLPGSAMMMGM